MKEGSEIVAAGCVNVRQGDIVGDFLLPSVDDGSAPNGVAMLSQTCDVVQPSKTRCLVAPVIEANEKSLRDARKGRKPLHLFLSQGK